jgi:hypothetical protein
MPREHTLSPELRTYIDPPGSQNLFPVGRNLPSGHPGHFVSSLILLSLQNMVSVTKLHFLVHVPVKA